MPTLSDLDVTIKVNTEEFDLVMKRMQKQKETDRRCWNCHVYCIGLFCWDCVRSWIVGVGMALLTKWLVG